MELVAGVVLILAVLFLIWEQGGVACECVTLDEDPQGE
jgi:hypothetical protein